MNLKFEKIKQSAQTLKKSKQRHLRLLYFSIFTIFSIALLIIVLPYRPKIVAINNNGETLRQIIPVYNSEEKPTFLLYSDTIVREAEKKRLSGTFQGQVGSITAQVYGIHGLITDLEPQIESLGSDPSVFRITISNERLLVPGKLSLRLQLSDNQRQWVLWKDFRWNATILNFNQSSYTLGEAVQIALGLLDTAGNPVCDARVNLFVTSPERVKTYYHSQDNTVIASPACSSKEKSVRPDYSVAYIPTSEGRYAVSLEATDGVETWIKESTFIVTSASQFTVRYITTQTRIFSRIPNTVTIELRTDQPFDGEVYYDIPKRLNVDKINANGNLVKGNNFSDSIVWPINIQSGESQSFSFTFTSANQGLEIYRTGPLRIINANTLQPVETVNPSENLRQFISPYSWEFIAIPSEDKLQF